MPLTQVQGGMLAGSTNTTTTIQSNGTTAITIDSSQNVGIGTASPAVKFDVTGTVVASGLNARITNLDTDASARAAMQYKTGASSNVWQTFAINGALVTGVAGVADYMRIDSSGRLLINATASVDNNARIQAFSTAGNGNANFIASLAGGSGASNANQTVGYMVGQTNCQIYAAWDGSGNARNSVYVSAVSQGVQLSSGASSWSAISDERQKDIIEPITDAITKVSSLRSVIGKYKNDDEGKRRSFLIAQDVQAVLPEAVTVEDEGQDTEKLLLAYSDVIPLLVASIRELNAKVEAQAAEIAALKATP